MSEKDKKISPSKNRTVNRSAQNDSSLPKKLSNCKKIEQAYLETELHCSNALNSLFDSILIVDRELKITLINDAFKEWNKKLGLSDNMVGKYLFEVFPFLPNKVKQEYDQVIQKRESLITEEHVNVLGRNLITEARKIPVLRNGETVQIITMIRDITERKKIEERITKINKCFLDFSSNADENINKLVALCGKIMGGKCSVYNRLEGGLLCSVGKWNTPKDYNSISNPEGHICYDVIKRGSGKFWIVRNLPQSRYGQSDPNVKSFGLQTYIGISVSFNGKCVSALCVVYQEDVVIDNDDKKFMQLIASAIASEEKRKESEKALLTSKEKYKTLTHNVNIGIYRNTAGSHGKFIEANPAVIKMFGYKNRRDFLIRNVCDLYQNKADREKFSRKLLEKGFVKNEELRLKKKDGKAFLASVSAVAIKDDNGEIKYYDGIVEDITERKQSEVKLRKSEEKYRFLFEKSAILAIVVGEDKKIKDVNKWTWETLGYARNEIIGKTALDFVVPEERERAREELKKSFNDEISSGVGINVLAKDGSTHTILFSPGQVLLQEKVKISSILLTGLDITDRKISEKNQLDMTSHLRAVVAATDELINCSNLEVVYRWAVEFARNKLGLERCAIFLEEGGYVQGIYGTDKNGNTTDEHTNRFLKNESWKQRFRMLHPQDPSWVVVKEPQLEWDGDKTVQIGEGWIVITPIQSTQRPIGVLVNDTAISGCVLDPMKQDTLAVFCSLLGNIIERKRAENKLEIVNKKLLQSNRRLKQLALRDSHTGLYNHRYLEEAINSEFDRAKRYAYSLSVIMLDIDYFKSINDVYGHQFGDLILKQFSRQLKRLVRKYDTVIRFGGEEFIILSPGIDRFTAMILARRLLNVVNLCNFGNQENSIKLKLSLSISSYPEDNASKGMDLINLVDQILNRAKEDGGDRVYSSQEMGKEKDPVLNKVERSTDINFLQEKIDKLTRRANQSLIEAIFAFAKTIKLKDDYTGEHVEETVFFATEIARRLKLTKFQIEQIRQASKLHDLGKIGVSERILRKKSKLTKKEFDEIKKHTLIGADILRPIHFLHDIIPLILYHHERWDGTGYPYGLKKEEIPVGARIVAVADTFQALTSDRPYRKAFSKAKAKTIVRENAGTQFDPKIVNAFLALT